MLKFFKKCCTSKRECMTYIIILFWIAMGIFASYYDADFKDLAAYFISLTGFIAAYIFGETKRKSTDTSLFKKGPNSKREILTYIVILIWAIVGGWVIYNSGDLGGASAYFAALTPFVGSYIIGETFRKNGSSDTKSSYKQINS